MDNNRSTILKSKEHLRYWWFTSNPLSFDPPIIAMLSDAEWNIMLEWFEETEKIKAIGECNIPVMCVLQGLIMGSCIERIVQCGTYAGYSTLLLGFMLRKMGVKHSLFSIDIDNGLSIFTKNYIDKAGLSDYVKVFTSDSADSKAAEKAIEYLQGNPQLVFIDSSHQYTHTLKELNLWYPLLHINGFIYLHDTSTQATFYDTQQTGGVKKAIQEWSDSNQQVEHININKNVITGTHRKDVVYLDGCGLGIIQK
jgi:predicted O-methyltransferase YrrM